MPITDVENKVSDVSQRLKTLIAAAAPSDVAFLDAMITKAGRADSLEKELLTEREDWATLVELLSLRVEQVERHNTAKSDYQPTSVASSLEPSYENVKFVPHHFAQPFALDEMPLVIDFSHEPLPSFVDGVTGLSWTESWGRWTDSDICRIILNKPIIGKLEVLIHCYASVLNQHRSVVCVLGGDTLVFRPGGTNNIYRFRLNTFFPSKTIEFFIPNAISPERYHGGTVSEPRRLGIALNKIEIRAFSF